MNQQNIHRQKIDRNQIFKLKGKTIVTKTGYLESRNRDPASTRFFMKHGPKGDPNPELRLSREGLYHCD